MSRHRAALLAAGMAFAAAACGIATDSAPRDVPQEERTLVNISATAGADAGGADRIFLVGPGEERLLRSVPREAVPGLTLIEILLLGPNDDEIASQFTTVIPSGTRVLSSQSQGSLLRIDLSEEIAELTGPSLTQALAQIVYTANELDDIEAVQITVNDELLSWPRANGTTTTGPLRIYDYPNFAQTAQPAFPAVPSAA